METNYNFSKNSTHVKFFKWMWNVDPTIRFKTMCPYFWQYLGSIIILPLILLWKLFKVIMTPIAAFVYKFTDEKERKQYDELFVLLSIKDLTDKELLKIYRMKCFRKHFDELFYAKDNRDENGNWQMDTEWRSKVESVLIFGDAAKENKKYEVQQVTDKLSYGWFGKVVASILMVVLVYLIGWGGYELLHLFTWTQFVDFLKVTGIVLMIIGIFWFIGYIALWIVEKLTCETPLKNVVFWRHIGNFFRMIGRTIVYIIRTTLDMIVNFYKNQCPVINWQDDTEK